MQIEKLDIKDGDILVVKHPSSLSLNARQNIQEIIQNSIGNKMDIRVIVLDEGMETVILRPEKNKNNLKILK